MADGPHDVPQDSDDSRTGELPRGGSRPKSTSAETGPPTWIALSGLGFEFVAAILLPGAIGWWLDRMLGSVPWIMLAGGLLGFAIGLRLLMRSVNRPRGK